MEHPEEEEKRRLLHRGADTSSGHEDQSPEPAAAAATGFFSGWDFRDLGYRYFMLVLMCFLSFGSYYVYDNPAALQRTIINVMNIDTTRFVLLYSLYSWPNVILSVFGGYLLDRVFGIRLGTIIFSLLICAGQLVFSLGAFFNSFITMATGRFIFGLGGENLAVAQNTYAVMWFKGKELNMVFGLLLSVSRIGSTVNMNINQKMYDSSTFSFIRSIHSRLGTVLLVGLLFCIFSLLCGVVLGFFDWRAAKIIGRKKKDTGEKISLRDVKEFPLTLWVIFIICVTYYVTVFPFIGLATVFLMDKYFVTSSQANLLNSLVYLISAAASPFIGILVDRTGFNLFWLNLGIVLTLAAHAFFAFLGNSFLIPYFAMALMGLAYSLLACALWPLVAFITPDHQLGTAYGIMQAIQNLGLAIFTIVTGAIVDSSGYLILEVFFLATLCVALISGIFLYILDSGQGGKLNMSAWGRAKLEKEKKARESVSPSPSSPINVPKKDTSGGRIDVFHSGTKDSYVTPPIPPSSAFHIRNRMLSKMGAKLPDHVIAFDPLTSTVPQFGVLK